MNGIRFNPTGGSSVWKRCDCFLPNGIKGTTDEELESVDSSTLMEIVDGKPRCPKCQVEFEVTEKSITAQDGNVELDHVPIFTVTDPNGHKYEIYLDGLIDGFPGRSQIVNHLSFLEVGISREQRHLNAQRFNHPEHDQRFEGMIELINEHYENDPELQRRCAELRARLSVRKI